jgi:hypothetical protein
MTESRQSVYVSDDFSEPMGAQHNFANNFDLENPDRAMSDYQRYAVTHSHSIVTVSNIILESCTSTQSVSSPPQPTLPVDEAQPHHPTSLSAPPGRNNRLVDSTFYYSSV